MTKHFDVIVIGGGPAGSALALRLAQLGRSAAIIEKAAFPRPHIGESLSGGILPLIDLLRLRGEWEPRPRGAIIQWAGHTKRTQPDADANWVVDRGHLDTLLLNAGRRAGVRVFQPARLAGRTFDGIWSVRLETGEILTSNILADASGRSGVLGGPRITCGARTMAMSAYWSGVDPAEDDMLVEAGESAWYWGARIPDSAGPNRGFHAMVFTTPEHARVALYTDLLRASRLLWSRLANATSGAVRVCDATPLLNTAPVSPHSIKVGDAALSIDPLSSQGVQTAVGTAIHAAVVIHTMIGRPEDTELAMSFYRNRLKNSADFHSHASRMFYREQSEVCGTDFWRTRAGKGEVRTTLIHTPIHPAFLVRKADKALFKRIGVVKGEYISQQEAVDLNGKHYAWIGGAAIADLLRALNHATPVTDVIDGWAGLMARTQALETLQWAWAEGLIERAI